MRNKTTAVLMAAMLGISTFPLNAMADSYKEAEKAAITKTVENFCNYYAKALDHGDSVKNSSSIDLNLSSEGSAVLADLSSLDLSWLNSANISMNNSFDKDSSAQSANLYVNGNKICTLNFYMDSSDSSFYLNIPELNDGYIKGSLMDVGGNDTASEESLHMQMEAADILENYFTAKDKLPNADVLQKTLDKYAGIIIDNVVEQAGSTESVKAGDVEEELSVLTADVDQYAAAEIVSEIEASAKKDEDLKSVIETLLSFSHSSDYTYDDFLMSLDDMKTSLAEDNDLESETGNGESDIAPGGCYQTEKASAFKFALNSYVDADGNIVGRQITAGEKEEEVPIFKCLKTKDGDKEGYILQIGEASEGILLEGSGTVDGNMLNGNYDISVGGEKMLTLGITDHDLSLWKDGKIKGSYGISGITDGKFDGLGLTFTVDGAEDKTDVRASLSVKGDYLGSLSISSENKDQVTVPDKKSMDKVYDFSSEKDVTAYTDSMDMETILNNLEKAGMPEGWLESLIGQNNVFENTEEAENWELKPAA